MGRCAVVFVTCDAFYSGRVNIPWLNDNTCVYLGRMFTEVVLEVGPVGGWRISPEIYCDRSCLQECGFV